MTNHPEKIMCIKSDVLFEHGNWQGLKTDELDKYRKLIIENSEFLVRQDLEDDPSYQQVIAQVILRNEGKYFLHKQKDMSESRLNGLKPLPLGGHIEEFDKKEGEDIIEIALERELHEEVSINGNITKREFLGLLNITDDNPVNNVHIGLLYLFDLDSQDVHIKEDGLEEIGFVDLEYLKGIVDELTYWSRIVINHL